MENNARLRLSVLLIVFYQSLGVSADADHRGAEVPVERKHGTQSERKTEAGDKRSKTESGGVEEHPDFGGIDVSPNKWQEQDLGAVFPVGISGRYMKMGFNLIDFLKPEGEKQELNTLLSFQYRPIFGGKSGGTCSGTVVEAPRASGCKKQVITAAHCVIEKECKESGEVTLEGSEWASKNGKAEQMKFKFKIHPKYMKDSNSCKVVPHRGDTAILEVANPEDCKRLTKALPVCTKEHLKKNKGEIYQSSGRKGRLVKYKPSKIEGDPGSFSKEIFNMEAIGMPSTNKLLEYFPEMVNGSGVGDSGGPFIFRTGGSGKGEYCVLGNVHGGKGDGLTNVTPHQGASTPLEWLLDVVGSPLQGGAGPGTRAEREPADTKQPVPNQGQPSEDKQTGKQNEKPTGRQDEPTKGPGYPQSKTDHDSNPTNGERPAI